MLNVGAWEETSKRDGSDGDDTLRHAGEKGHRELNFQHIHIPDAPGLEGTPSKSFLA